MTQPTLATRKKIQRMQLHEWVTKGEIEDPFTQDTLDKLQMILEEKKELTLR